MRTVLLTCVVFMLVGLMGCSGGGGNTNPQQAGSLVGTLNAANPASYRIVVDGQPLAAAPQADGSFSIPNLPAGPHTIAFISGSGMVGIYLPVEIDPGRPTDIGDVSPVQGGQIVGFVMRTDDAGNLTPLAGVEVLADPEPIYYYDGDDPQPAQVQTREAEELTLTAITEEDGSYRIPAVPEGSYVVTVNVPGLMQGVAYVWVSAGTTSPADFQLVAAVEEGIGTVRGHVTAALEAGAQALAGAMVTIYSDGGWRPVPPTEPITIAAAIRSMGVAPPGVDYVIAPPYIFNQFATLTAADGSYTLNVPSGHLQINVWAEGYEGAYDSLTLQPDATATKDYALTPWTDVPVPIHVGDPSAGAGR